MKRSPTLRLESILPPPPPPHTHTHSRLGNYPDRIMEARLVSMTPKHYALPRCAFRLDPDLTLHWHMNAWKHITLFWFCFFCLGDIDNKCKSVHSALSGIVYKKLQVNFPDRLGWVKCTSLCCPVTRHQPIFSQRTWFQKCIYNWIWRSDIYLVNLLGFIAFHFVDLLHVAWLVYWDCTVLAGLLIIHWIVECMTNVLRNLDLVGNICENHDWICRGRYVRNGLQRGT